MPPRPPPAPGPAGQAPPRPRGRAHPQPPAPPLVRRHFRLLSDTRIWASRGRRLCGGGHKGPPSGKEGKQTWGRREPGAAPSARRGQGSRGQAVRWALSGPRRSAARALSAGLEAAARPRPASHVATPPRRPGSPPPPLANHTEARGGGGALERMLLGFLGVSGRSQRGYGGLPDGVQGPDVEEAGYLYSSWRLLFFFQGC